MQMTTEENNNTNSLHTESLPSSSSSFSLPKIEQPPIVPRTAWDASEEDYGAESFESYSDDDDEEDKQRDFPIPFHVTNSFRFLYDLFDLPPTVQLKICSYLLDFELKTFLLLLRSEIYFLDDSVYEFAVKELWGAEVKKNNRPTWKHVFADLWNFQIYCSFSKSPTYMLPKQEPGFHFSIFGGLQW